jgi:hypothetical protein
MRCAAETLSDNLANPSSGTQTLSQSIVFAESFKTGWSAYTLTSVDLAIKTISAGSLTVGVYSDQLMYPGTLLGSLTSSGNYPSTLSTVNFSGSVPLSANTRYWILVSATSGSFGWSWTGTGGGTGPGYLGEWGGSPDGGATWYTNTVDSVQMRVNATPTSAPSLSISLSHGGPFQQGQSNATYTAVVSNTTGSATSEPVTVTATIPNGLVLAGISGSGWSCAANACTRSDALATGASYPPLAIAVNVDAGAPPSLTTQITVSGGGSASATSADMTPVNPVSSGPQLRFVWPPTGGMAFTHLMPISVQVVDSGGNPITTSTASITLTSTPASIFNTVSAVNGVATFKDVAFSAAGMYAITASSSGLSSVTSNAIEVVNSMPETRIGIVRSNAFNFDSNGNQGGPSPIDAADRVDPFTPPGGVLTGDVPVIGDWNGDAHAKAGWFRPTGGYWWLDVNNNGTYDSGDLTYSGFGGAGDVPVIGDWTGSGKSGIGFVTGGFLWVLDLNADGAFQQPSCKPLDPPATTPAYPDCGSDPIIGDAVFPFGVKGDAPVVGNWYGKVSESGYRIDQVGMVRPYVVDNVAKTGPFLWLLDSAIAGNPANVTPPASHAIGNLPGTVFGGAMGDVPITGDWVGSGISQFGVVRGGFLWILDTAAPLAPTQSIGIVFPYGGLPGDVPIVGKW